jgi:hypothetical protein
VILSPGRTAGDEAAGKTVNISSLSHPGALVDAGAPAIAAGARGRR